MINEGQSVLSNGKAWEQLPYRKFLSQYEKFSGVGGQLVSKDFLLQEGKG